MCMRGRLEIQVALSEQGACCEQRPAALTCSAPACQATPQPAGGNLQLQHLCRINSSASTLRASRCERERYRGLAGTCGHALAHVKGNTRCFINLLQCRCLFPLCGDCTFLVNNGATGTCSVV